MTKKKTKTAERIKEEPRKNNMDSTLLKKDLGSPEVDVLTAA